MRDIAATSGGTKNNALYRIGATEDRLSLAVEVPLNDTELGVL